MKFFTLKPVFVNFIVYSPNYTSDSISNPSFRSTTIWLISYEINLFSILNEKTYRDWHDMQAK